jgi:CheY-like chemotaxis protein
MLASLFSPDRLPARRSPGEIPIRTPENRSALQAGLAAIAIPKVSPTGIPPPSPFANHHRMTEPKPTILLVEDNEEDAFLLRRALRMEHIDCALQTAEDGQEAIEYLGGVGKYADRATYPFPNLVLLDLKLPYVHGFEVLAWVATQPTCKDLKIIILTSSGEDRDREKAEQFGIKTYFTKPPSKELVSAVAKSLQEVCSTK